MITEFPEWLKQRLKKTLPGKDAQIRMMPQGDTKRYPIPENAKKSSILLLLYPDQINFSIIAIKRSADGGVHSGQIAFPGGKMEAFDDNPEATALREAHEEINLNPNGVQLLGRLSPLYIPVSRFEVFPIVGFEKGKPENLISSEAEVSQLLSISLENDLGLKTEKKIAINYGKNFLTAPGYQINGEHFLWGASAMILSELEALWNEFRKII